MTLQEAEKYIKEFEAKFTADTPDPLFKVSKLMTFYRSQMAWLCSDYGTRFIISSIEKVMNEEVKEVSNVG